MQTARSYAATAVVCGHLAILGACAATQAEIDSGSRFATAGIAYVDALPAVFDESFRLTVRMNSDQLLLARQDLLDSGGAMTAQDSQDTLADALESADELLAARQQLLENLRRHSRLLRSYFTALQALTDKRNASGITATTRDIVASLAALRPGIEGTMVGNAKVTDLTGPGVQLVVANYENAALREELRLRGGAIERELALQQAVLEALADDMIDNAETIIQVEELNPIFEEFTGDGRVSAAWSDRRTMAFKQSVSLDSYNEIKKAAATMHRAWIALVENRDSEMNLDALLRDIESFLALARLFEAGE